MATLKQIRQRIRTSKNIQQITRAMKLVAAARLTRAKLRVEEARPYAEKMRELIASLGSGEGLPDHPLLERREKSKQLLVLVTADRGLAGSYNSQILRKASDYLKAQTVETDVLAVGKKGYQFFGKRGYNIIEQFTVPTAGGGLEEAVELGDKLEELFKSGQYDAVSIMYSKFISPIRQEPTLVPLLPVEPPEFDEEQSSQYLKEYRFEPPAPELLGQLLPKYTLTLVLQALLEAAASEHGARMTAMTSATDNAGKMIGDLTLQANRARQAGITKEILEIVGGAEALKG